MIPDANQLRALHSLIPAVVNREANFAKQKLAYDVELAALSQPGLPDWTRFVRAVAAGLHTVNAMLWMQYCQFAEQYPEIFKE